MDAELLLSERIRLADGVFAELVIWLVPEPVRASAHPYKYRLALVADGTCVLRYDNEAGKGDRKHIGTVEQPFHFVDVKTLQAAFLADVRSWIDENHRG